MMAIFEHLVLAALHLGMIAVDVLMLLALVRLLAHRRHWPWLIALARAARPVMDPLVEQSRRMLGHKAAEPPLLIAGLLVLGAIRLVMALVFRVVAL